MAEDDLFPPYILRDEEQDILAVIRHVQKDRKSQAVLLYGPGGVGKTRLVRALADRQARTDAVTWLRPVDLDDQEYWLLTNLQASVARQLDPDSTYFRPFTEYLSRPLASAREHVTADTVISRIGYGRRIFLDCYHDYVRGRDTTVVMVFDTAEVIRGMTLLVALTQWMKSLPATAFIVSGRPMPDGAGGRQDDPIEEELADPHRPMPVTKVPLGEFSRPAAERYLAESRVAQGLTNQEKAKIVLLTRGHPLWLALAVSYLDVSGLPEEATVSLPTIERDMPYRGPLTPAGQRRQEDFKRRLLTPYRETDFWHESVKRLVAVRQGINEPMWLGLMKDRPLPSGIRGADEAWRRLTETPWIRRRANGAAVTLHDAMAEELAKRVIPVHDQSQQWRKDLWRRMVTNCDKQIGDAEIQFQADARKLESRRQLAGESGPPAPGRCAAHAAGTVRQRGSQARSREAETRSAEGSAVPLPAAFRLQDRLPVLPRPVRAGTTRPRPAVSRPARYRDAAVSVGQRPARCFRGR